MRSFCDLRTVAAYLSVHTIAAANGSYMGLQASAHAEGYVFVAWETVVASLIRIEVAFPATSPDQVALGEAELGTQVVFGLLFRTY
jgi:hypothetical protein